MGKSAKKGFLSSLITKKSSKKYTVSQVNSFMKQAYIAGGYRNSTFLSGGQSGQPWRGGLDSSYSGWNEYVDNYETRRRARSSYMDQPMFLAIINRMADTVIDSGLKPESAIDYRALGMTEEEAAEWKATVESSFMTWASSKKSNREENMTFFQLQRFFFVQQFRDGEYFARFFYSPDSSLQNPLQISSVGQEMINGIGVTDVQYDGSAVYCQDGINRDLKGREISYNISVVQPDGQLKQIAVPAVGPKSGKRFMVHGYQAKFNGQGRGFSEVFQALPWVQKITDLFYAQVQKEINNASITAWIEPSDSENAVNPLSDLDIDGLVAENDFEDIQSAADAESYQETGSAFDFQDRSDLTYEKPGIFVANLQKGQKLKAFEYERKNTEFNVFVDSVLSYVASAFGMSIEVLKMEFNQNYSASRAALKLFWRKAGQWRMEFASDLLTPVYESWLDGEIAAGKIKAPGWADPKIKSLYTKVNWIGPPEPDIDPSKQAKAMEAYINMGLTTREREARNLNGSSFMNNVVTLKKENSMLAEANEMEMEDPEIEEEEDEITD